MILKIVVSLIVMFWFVFEIVMLIRNIKKRKISKERLLIDENLDSGK